MAAREKKGGSLVSSPGAAGSPPGSSGLNRDSSLGVVRARGLGPENTSLRANADEERTRGQPGHIFRPPPPPACRDGGGLGEASLASCVTLVISPLMTETHI